MPVGCRRGKSNRQFVQLGLDRLVAKGRARPGLQLTAPYQFIAGSSRLSNDSLPKAFFDLLPDLLCVIEEDGRLVDISKAWTDPLGWTRRNLLSRPLLELIHADDVGHKLAIRGALHTGKP